MGFGIYLTFIFAILIVFADAGKTGSKNQGTTPRLCGYKANEVPKFTLEPDLEPKFVSQFKKGFYIPLQSAHNYNPEDLTQSQPFEKVSKTKNCYDMQVKAASLTTFTVMVECQYIGDNPTITRQRCNLVGTLGVDLLPIAAFGKFYATMTDNSTFLVGFSCVFNKDPIWFVMSASKKLSEERREEVSAHLESLGFDPNNVANDETPLLAYKFTKVDCDKQAESLSVPVDVEEEDLGDQLALDDLSLK